TLDQQWTRQSFPTQPVRARDVDPSLAAIVDALQVLTTQAERGGSLSAGLASASARQQTSRSEGSQESLAEIGRIGQRTPECQTIAAFLDIAIRSITEPSLEMVAARYRAEFGDAALRARMLTELLLSEGAGNGSASVDDATAAAS